MAETCIFGIIIEELSNQQEFSLVILFEVIKNLEISLYSVVLVFCCIINLKVMGNCKPLFDTKAVAE